MFIAAFKQYFEKKLIGVVSLMKMDVRLSGMRLGLQYGFLHSRLFKWNWPKSAELMPRFPVYVDLLPKDE